MSYCTPWTITISSEVISFRCYLAFTTMVLILLFSVLCISKLSNNVLDPSKKFFKFGVIYDSISTVHGVFSFYISLLSFKCYVFDG